MNEFRLYADEHRKYWCLVRLADTASQMRADIRRLRRMKVDKNVAGQVVAAGNAETGAFAVMWLARDEIRRRPNELTAHECGHAALRYVERRGWSYSNSGTMDDEERICYALGRMQRRLITKLYKLGVFS